MIEKIYFDMDGVLADFNRGVRELCGIEPSQQGKSGTREQDDLMWEKIRGVEHFYDRLEPMPGAVEMFKKIHGKYKDCCEILTGIPKPKRGIEDAGADKTKWVHRILSDDLKVNIVFREEKRNYCKGKNYILIDDLQSNIADWEKYGGTGILHIGAGETLKAFREKKLL